MKNALEVSHLTKDYGSFKLDDVSFTVPGGTIMGLIGENGAGKSTTIKCILNLIRRDGGEIQVLGLDNLRDEQAVKAQVGVVLDETTFHDGLTAPQVGKILSKLYPGWDAALYQRYLDKFGLTGKKPVKTFSKGMKMKLSLAAAFAARPKLLILDEATSGLDPVVRDEILDEFLNFIQDEEHSILISSHILEELSKIATDYGIIHNGTLLQELTNEELMEKCSERLEVTLDDPERAVPVMDRLGIKRYQVADREHIYIFERLEESAALNMAFAKAGIPVRGISVTNEELETYFLKLTGGGANA